MYMEQTRAGTAPIRSHDSPESSAGSIRSIALIGTYVPRRCGIATFTADAAAGLGALPNGPRVVVVALNDRPEGYDYPSEVQFEIQQNQLQDYYTAADYLHANRVDAVCIQHEFGIFGGRDGSHILKLMSRLRMPVITVLHTVARRPDSGHRAIVQQIAERSDRIVVLSQMAADFLHESYDVNDRVAYAPHGIPDLPFVDPNYYKDQFDVEGRKVILSFGLLSPNKGFEYMIRAMPRVVKAHPDAAYVILGATHPHVRKAHGESYRLELQRLAASLGVGDRVLFHDRYVDLRELCEFLGAADLYVTPYLNEEQVVSGTLAYALGAGKAVISTPYWYASEMLADGRGRLVPFRDADALAAAVSDLLSDEQTRHAMRKRAYRFQRNSVWSAVAGRYLDIVSEVCADRVRSRQPQRRFAPRQAQFAIPAVDFTHVHRLTDDVGILQHATSYIPNRHHGYCTDDNARALIVSAAARGYVSETEGAEQLVERYLAFLVHAFVPGSGVFRNFMNYDRTWAETVGSPDSHGRAIWALGVSVAELPDERLRNLAMRMLHDALPRLEHIADLRATACALLGLVGTLERFGGDTIVRRMRDALAQRLFSAFLATEHEDEWDWPEPFLTYDNGRLPQALLEAGRQLEREDYVEVGLRSLEWLVRAKTVDGHFSPVGNQGWHYRGATRARFDQQPVEAAAVVAACATAYHTTRDQVWLERARVVFEWFLGRNDVGQSLYDPSTGGCRDGLHANGVSENQGAESTLAWLSSLLQVHALHAVSEADDGRAARAVPDLASVALDT
jgi:glycosyltransferase involved in cell wall biosynthesis